MYEGMRGTRGKRGIRHSRSTRGVRRTWGMRERISPELKKNGYQ